MASLLPEVILYGLYWSRIRPGLKKSWAEQEHLSSTKQPDLQFRKIRNCFFNLDASKIANSVSDAAIVLHIEVSGKQKQ